ncbi:hypothetical protein ACL02O_29490 [Micromonospora sp. MS34]|uniref:hypothetical protein n=1 Tax=Micromonospora sp. MS34 TaxID=3385971 RepID=UPI0039A11C2E
MRYGNGRPITSGRYDHLWKRIGQQLPWVAAQGISTHWLRHTTLSWVEGSVALSVGRVEAGGAVPRSDAVQRLVTVTLAGLTARRR